MESIKPVKCCELENIDKMDIIRTASYHRRGFDVSVLRKTPRDHDQVRSSLLQTIPTTSLTLGEIKFLPLDVILDIFSLLDIQSLFNFRHVNRRALQLVARTRGYDVVIRHALGSLRAILRTKVASWFTILDLFKALCSSSFGGFIFLPSFMRCCFCCFRMDHLPSVAQVSTVKELFKPSQSYLRGLVPMVTTLPGSYADIVRTQRYQIMPTEFVGTLSARGRHSTSRLQVSLSLKYMVTTSLPYLDVESGVLQNGICCSGCDAFLRKDHLEISPNPSLEDLWTLRDKVYSYDEFMEHFRGCREAQSLWKLNNQGIDVSEISGFFKSGGGEIRLPSN